MMLYKDAETFVKRRYRKERFIVIGKYCTYSTMLFSILIMIIYPVLLFFFTTDYLWIFSVLFFFSQSVPLILLALMCLCFASIHFLTSSCAHIAMALVFFTSFLILVVVSILVSLNWVVYSSTFYWELFLAAFMPSFLSLHNGLACCLLSITEVARFRSRRKYFRYERDPDACMYSKPIKPTPKLETVNSESSQIDLKKKESKCSKSEVELVISKVTPFDDGLREDEKMLSTITSTECLSSFTAPDKVRGHSSGTSESKYSTMNIDEISLDVSPVQRTKSSTKLHQVTSRDRLLPNVVPADNFESLDSDAIDILSDEDSDDSFLEVNEPTVKKTSLRKAYSNDTVYNGNIKENSSLNSNIRQLLRNQSSPIAVTRPTPFQNNLSSATSTPNILSKVQSFRNLGNSTSRVRAAEKEAKRVEFELKEAAGPEWEKFVKREKKKGKEPLWENFLKSKKEHKSDQQSVNILQRANQSFSMLSKLKNKLGSSLPQSEMKTLEELSEKFSIPMKNLMEQHSRLNKKYSGAITRKHIKQAFLLPKVSRNLLNSMFRLAGKDDSESITPADWMKVMMQLRKGKIHDRLAAIFSVFDYDENGILDFNELRSMVHALSPATMSKEDVKVMTQRLFKKIDTNHTNNIDMNAFITFTSKDDELMRLIFNMTRNVDFC